MMDKITNWIFSTVHGRIVGLCLLPVALVLWIVSSLVVGEDFFEWLDSREIRKAAGL